jgi:hypothetical protein
MLRAFSALPRCIAECTHCVGHYFNRERLHRLLLARPMTLPKAVRGVPLGMRKNPEYFDSADRPVVAADILVREAPDDEEEDEDEEEEEGEDNDEEEGEEEDEGYSE